MRRSIFTELLAVVGSKSLDIAAVRIYARVFLRPHAKTDQQAASHFS